MHRHTSVILLASILFVQCLLQFLSHFLNDCISRMTLYVQRVTDLSRMILERQQKPAEGYGEIVMLFVSVISLLLC